LVLLFVALETYFDRVYSTDWDAPLRVAVYPLNGDGSARTEGFIRQLAAGDLDPLEGFFEQEAGHHGLAMQRPIRFTLAPQLRTLPPALAPDSGRPGVMLWS